MLWPADFSWRRYLRLLLGGAVLAAGYAAVALRQNPPTATFASSLLLGAAAMVAYEITKRPRWLPVSIALLLVAALLTPFAFDRPDWWVPASVAVMLATLLAMHYFGVRRLPQGNRSEADQR